jgi:hypothetical protein
VTELPQSCPYGHTNEDLRIILGDRLPEFNKWMVGQTGQLCDGRWYDYAWKRYRPDKCKENPHGPVVYASDLRQFLSGRGPVDW